MNNGKFSQEDYQFVFNWLQKHCYGREHARFREDYKDIDENVIKAGILPYMPKHITDRKFRFIVSALAHEGHVYSSSAWGYFFMPPVNPARCDIVAAKKALIERKTKALSTIEKVGFLLRKLEELEQKVQDLFPEIGPREFSSYRREE